MRSFALLGWMMVLATGCTVHVVQQPGYAVAAREPAPVQYDTPRHRQARPTRHHESEPAAPRPARPVKTPPSTSKPEPTKPPGRPVKPGDVRPGKVATKPKPKPEDKVKVRTVRDAGPRAVGEPTVRVDNEHSRAHAMER